MERPHNILITSQTVAAQQKWRTCCLMGLELYILIILIITIITITIIIVVVIVDVFIIISLQLPEAAAGSHWTGSSQSSVVGRQHQFLPSACFTPAHILLTGGHRSVPAPQGLVPDQKFSLHWAAALLHMTREQSHSVPKVPWVTWAHVLLLLTPFLLCIGHLWQPGPGS